MAEKPDLEAYFRRVGYDGPAEPTLDTLRALHALHPQAIPFDGLSPFIGEPVALDLEALQAKLLGGSRGGYCYEQNVLLWKVLEAIGFKVRGLAGRVRLNWPDTYTTPRSHMALRVSLPQGEYIADVGYGGLTVTAPVRMEVGLEQPTPHEPVRLMEAPGGTYDLQSRVAGEWKTLYRFDLLEAFMPDYEMFNFWNATHPASPFVRGVIVARPLAGRRLALRNTRYSVHVTGEPTQTEWIEDVARLRTVLEEDFGIRIPWGGELEPRMQRLIDAEATRSAT